MKRINAINKKKEELDQIESIYFIKQNDQALGKIDQIT